MALSYVALAEGATTYSLAALKMSLQRRNQVALLPISGREAHKQFWLCSKLRELKTLIRSFRWCKDET